MHDVEHRASESGAVQRVRRLHAHTSRGPQIPADADSREGNPPGGVAASPQDAPDGDAVVTQTAPASPAVDAPDPVDDGGRLPEAHIRVGLSDEAPPGPPGQDLPGGLLDHERELLG